MNDLKQKYSDLDDFELLRIVYFEYADYTEEAIQLAKSILIDRGLNQPSEEMIQKVKEYIETPVSEFDFLDDKKEENIFKKGNFRDAVKKKDYYLFGKLLFWLVVVYAFTSVFLHEMNYLSPEKKLPENYGILEWFINNLIEIVFTITIFGLIPIIFLIFHSLKLSKKQRKEKRLVLFLPSYILIIYGISIIIFFLVLYSTLTMN